MSPIINIVLMILNVYSFVLVARALISWVPNIGQDNPAVRILYAVTEPVLEPIRKLIPPVGGVMDISMLIAFFAIIVLEQLLRSMY